MKLQTLPSRAIRLCTRTLPIVTSFFILGNYLLPLLDLIDFSVHAAPIDPIDRVEMDEALGSTHNLVGWSVADLPGNYGGCHADPNCHYSQVVERPCTDAGRVAEVTLHAGTNFADTLRIRHLDGLADDGFKVYVNGSLVYTYTDVHPSETWVTTPISLGNLTGDINVRFEATGAFWTSCDTYGQVAISWMEIAGNTQIDYTTPDITNLSVSPEYLAQNLSSWSGPIDNMLSVSAQVTDPSGVRAVSADFSYNPGYTDRPSPTSVAMYDPDSDDIYEVDYGIPATWRSGNLYVKVAARDNTPTGNWGRGAETETVLIDNQQLDIVNITTDDTLYRGGETITLSVTVANIGQVDVTDGRLRVGLDHAGSRISSTSQDYYFGSEPPLAPGNTRTLTFTQLVSGTWDGNDYWYDVAIYGQKFPITYWYDVINRAIDLTFDNTPPFVEVTSHNDGDLISGTVDVRGTVTDANPHHYWAVVHNSGGTTVAGPGVVNRSDSFTDELLFTWDTTSVGDGTYTIKLEARDTAGNKNPNLAPIPADPEVPGDSVDWVTVTVDNTPPAKPQMNTIYKGHDPATWIEIGCGGYTNTPQVSMEWYPNSDPDIAGYWFGTQFNDHHQWFDHPNVVKTANMTPGHNPYYYTVIAVDHVGNESEISDPCSLILEQEPPSTVMSSPLNDLNWNLPIPIQGVSNDNYEVAQVDLYYRNAGSSDPWTHIINLDNPDDDAVFDWTYDWTPGSEGVYDIMANATDAAGNVESSAYAYNVTYDVTPPVVQITAPSDGDLVSGVVEIWGWISDTNLSHYNIAVYNGGVDTWNFSLRLEQQTVYTSEFGNKLIYTWDTSGYPDGEYQIRLAARDLAGNRDPLFPSFPNETGDSVMIITVTVDNTPPVSEVYLQGDLDETKNIVGDSGWHGYGWYESYDNVNLRISSGDTVNDFIHYQILSGDVICPAQGDAGYSSVSHDTNVNGDVNGTDGLYTLCYYAEDLAGNTESSTHKQLLHVDDTNPEYTIDYSSISGNEVSGVYYINSDTINVDVNITDNLSGYTRARYDLYTADASWNCTYNHWNQDNLLPPSTSTTRTFTESGLADGWYCLRIWVYDDVQNKAWTDTNGHGWVHFVIDTTPPTINDLDDQTFYEGEEVDLNLLLDGKEVLDNIGLSQACYSVISPIGNPSDCVDISYMGTGSTIPLPPVTTFPIDTSILPEGIYRITYYVTDLAGNESPHYTVTITINNVAPTPILGPRPGPVVINEGDNVTFSAFFNDPSYLASSPFPPYSGGPNTPDDGHWTVEIDYGEGAGFQPVGDMSEPGDIVAELGILSNVYENAGIYYVTLQVCENSTDPGEGACGTDQLQVTVTNNAAPPPPAPPPPAAPAGPGVGAAVAGAATTRGLVAGAQAAEEGEEDSDQEEEKEEDVLGEETCENPSKVSGYIYYDDNNNDQKDDDEEGLQDIIVSVYSVIDSEEKFVTTAKTDENGYWETELCAGNYKAKVDKEDLPKNTEITEEELSVSVEENKDTGDINFEVKKVGSKFNWLWCLIPLLILFLLVALFILFSKKEERKYSGLA